MPKYRGASRRRIKRGAMTGAGVTAATLCCTARDASTGIPVTGPESLLARNPPSSLAHFMGAPFGYAGDCRGQRVRRGLPTGGPNVGA